MLNFFKQSYSSNIPKFYIASFFEAMWFASPVWILFFLSTGIFIGPGGGWSGKEIKKRSRRGSSGRQD